MFEKHCPVCGMDVKKEIGVKRFGKYFCSVNHGEKYAQIVNEREREQRENNRGSGGCC